MSYIPEDVVADILSRLPAKSLLRFRCVSKPWCALIGSQSFIKLHLTRAIETNTNCSIINREGGYLYSVKVDSLNNAIRLDPPLSHRQILKETTIVGSCNGLLCLATGKYIFLWNPSTRNYWKSPLPRIPIGFKCVFLGFGYDDVGDDYKVVRMIQYCAEDKDTFSSEASVYSLKSDSWRKIEKFPYYLGYKTDSGVFISGALHWTVGQNHGSASTSTDAKLIVAFDLRTEEDWLVPQPQYWGTNFQMDVSGLGGCLCVIRHFFERYVDMWVMKDYRVEKSWTKLLSIAQPDVMGYFSRLWPVAYSNSCKQVLLLSQDHKRYIWYYLTTERIVSMVIGGMPVSIDSHVCLESLVQPRGGVESAGGSGRKFHKTETVSFEGGPSFIEFL